jgi:hypothetical protein
VQRFSSVRDRGSVRESREGIAFVRCKMLPMRPELTDCSLSGLTGTGLSPERENARLGKSGSLLGTAVRWLQMKGSLWQSAELAKVLGEGPPPKLDLSANFASFEVR